MSVPLGAFKPISVLVLRFWISEALTHPPGGSGVPPRAAQQQQQTSPWGQQDAGLRGTEGGLYIVKGTKGILNLD